MLIDVLPISSPQPSVECAKSVTVNGEQTVLAANAAHVLILVSSAVRYVILM